MTIGVFDGVHRGHQAILRRTVERAREKKGTSIVLTFSPHPQKVISPDQSPLILQTLRQKERLIEKLSIDILFRLPFTPELSLVSPEQFVRQILSTQRIREIYVGNNFRFGHRRAGTFKTLQILGEKFQFDVHNIMPVDFRGVRISSTVIRQAIQEGKVDVARDLLGRPYQVLGTVVQGAGKGKTIGFPTANIDPANELVPAGGVYITRTHINCKAYASVTNIGIRPTLNPLGRPTSVVEIHLLDFSSNIYGKLVKLDFFCRLRDEKKFPDVEHLKKQIKEDVRQTRKYWARIQRVSPGESNVGNHF